jgi:hypothetical protein
LFPTFVKAGAAERYERRKRDTRTAVLAVSPNLGK